MRNFRLPSLLIAALILGACRAPQAAQRSRLYVPPAAYYIPEARLESFKAAPPPEAGSETDSRDLVSLRDWQTRRTAPDCARALSEANVGYQAFFGDISPFPRPLPKAAEDLFAHVQGDAGRAVYFLKEIYKRPRPYNRDNTLNPCIPRIRGAAYPSGHAALARAFALVLADLAPQRSAEFLARADEIALDRVISGVHHPTDIEAGKRLGDGIHAELLRNPAFIADLELARRELRR